MNLVCEKSDLLRALSAVTGATDPRSHVPILGGCLLTAKEGVLTVLATNLEQTVKISIFAEIEEEGQAVVIHRIFLDLLRKTNAQKIAINTKSSFLQVKSGALSSKLRTWPVEDYPETEQMEEQAALSFQYPAQKWKRFIEKTIIAANPIRMQLFGVFVELLEREIRFVAADGYRLAVLKTENKTGISDSIFISAQSLSEVNRLIAENMGDLEITWDKTHIRFAHLQFVLQSRLMGADFPQYERVFPTAVTAELKMSREMLLDTLQRAILFKDAQKKYTTANILVEGETAVISADAKDIGSLREEITLSAPVDKQEVIFNAKYLLEPLQVMENKDAILRLHGSDIPGVYRELGEGWEYLHLISPIRKI